MNLLRTSLSSDMEIVSRKWLTRFQTAKDSPSKFAVGCIMTKRIMYQDYAGVELQPFESRKNSNAHILI